MRLFVKIRKACILNIVSNKFIIPEVVNSDLNKNNLLNSFKKLLHDQSYRNDQIKDINNYIAEIESKESPFDISVNRIMDLV